MLVSSKNFGFCMCFVMLGALGFLFFGFFLVISCCYTYIHGGCVSIFPYFVLLC